MKSKKFYLMFALLGFGFIAIIGTSLIMPNIKRLTSNDVMTCYKVGIHGHTINSCVQFNNIRGAGSDKPEDFLEAYRNLHYDAFAITDYNSITSSSIKNILSITGFEAIRDFPDWPHLLAIFVGQRHEHGLYERTPHQHLIDDINSFGGVAIAAHPNWVPRPWTVEKLESLKGLGGIEICNSGVDQKYAEDKWDRLLSDGFKVWGFGGDDAHSIQTNNIGDCFLDVVTFNLTVPKLRESIRNGNFYVRQAGSPQLSITVNDGTLFCRTSVESNISIIGDHGTVLMSEKGVKSAAYTINYGEVYIRVKATKNGMSSWSQPIFIDELK